MTETIKELICICCPKGCHLRVDTANDYAVTGNACPNGAAYGKEELTHPTRIITSTVRITGGLYPRCKPPCIPGMWYCLTCAAPAWMLWQRVTWKKWNKNSG